MKSLNVSSYGPSNSTISVRYLNGVMRRASAVYYDRDSVERTRMHPSHLSKATNISDNRTQTIPASTRRLIVKIEGTLQKHRRENIIPPDSSIASKNQKFVPGIYEAQAGQNTTSPIDELSKIAGSSISHVNERSISHQELTELVQGTFEALDPSIRASWQNGFSNIIENNLILKDSYSVHEITNELLSSEDIHNNAHKQLILRAITLNNLGLLQDSIKEHKYILSQIPNLFLTNPDIKPHILKGGAADFIAVTLFKGTNHMVRLHYYPVEAKPDASIHSHATDLTSIILAGGGLTNAQFMLEGHEEAKYVTLPPDVQSLFTVNYAQGGNLSYLINTNQLVSVKVGTRITFAPGQYYKLDAGMLHAVGNSTLCPTVTLICFNATKGRQSAYVLGDPNIDRIDKPRTNTELESYSMELLHKLEEVLANQLEFERKKNNATIKSNYKSWETAAAGNILNSLNTPDEILNLAQLADTKILDLGCGRGDVAYQLADLAEVLGNKVSITGVDFNANGIAEANKNKDNYLAKGHTLNFLQADATKLQLERNQFDAVFALSLFSAIPPELRDLAFQQAWNVLKPGGLFILYDFLRANHDPAKKRMYEEAVRQGYPEGTTLSLDKDDPTKIRFVGYHFEPYELERHLLKAGFSLKDMTYRAMEGITNGWKRYSHVFTVYKPEE